MNAPTATTYRVLSYYFSLTCEDERAETYLRGILAPFAVAPDPKESRRPPTPGLPVSYSLLDLGADAEQRYVLEIAAGILVRSAYLSDVVQHLIWHISTEASRQTGDFLLVHAGAVQPAPGVGMVLPAPSGSGKTTLVAALVQHGYGYLSDELALIDPVSRRLYPFPRALSFKKHPGWLLGDHVVAVGDPPAENLWHVHATDIRPAAGAGACPVRHIVEIRYEPDAATDVTELSRAQALLILVESALNFPTYGERALPLLADVVRGATCHRLVFGSTAAAITALDLIAADGPVG